jgi:hypothetical protein
MATSTASKYVSAHERLNSNELPAYSGHAAPRTRQANDSAPHHPIELYNSPVYRGTEESSQTPLRSPNNTELFFPRTNEAYDVQQGAWSQQASPQHHRPVRQHSYPTPTTPQQPIASAQQAQIYYPPPAGSPHSPHIPHPSPSDQGGSPSWNQYHGDTQHGDAPVGSSRSTQAEFYAQPVAVRGPAGSTESGQIH